MAGVSSSSTHPPLPPTTEDDRFDRLRLLRSRRVGVSTYYRMLAEHGSAAAALAELPRVAAEAGVVDYSPCPPAIIHAEFEAASRIGARLLVRGAPDYPISLNDLSDAPPLLWALGDTRLLCRPMVAMVGARNASSLGTRMAKRLAAELGEAGIVIVSGLARGVDAAAHSAALETGTIAVLGGGVDVLYPAENAVLAEEIASRGLRLSEQPMGLTPQARHFPVRNRIISGLAQATVVVEAAAKSGSLITARAALDQGREVMAVPGSPLDARASGCNMLIRDGATLVRSAEDVIEMLGPIGIGPITSEPVEPAAAPPPRVSQSALHSEILDRLAPAPLAEDQLLRDLSVGANAAAPVLTELELNGSIRRDPGGLLRRAS